jgi:hypothetical protein
MNIREMARIAGGDEAVAEIDLGKEIEEKALNAMRDLYVSILAEYGELKPGTQQRSLINAAFAEATSDAYARAAATFVIERNEAKTDEQKREAIAMAITSLAGNMMRAFENAEVAASGVEDLIKNAGKGGK